MSSRSCGSVSHLEICFHKLCLQLPRLFLSVLVFLFYNCQTTLSLFFPKFSDHLFLSNHLFNFIISDVISTKSCCEFSLEQKNILCHLQIRQTSVFAILWYRFLFFFNESTINSSQLKNRLNNFLQINSKGKNTYHIDLSVCRHLKFSSGVSHFCEEV